MRTLKKTLALVLVLAMMFSLCVTASAYTDDADIEYPAAVELLSALKVIEGYPDDSFKPEKTLNRAEAAVIIAKLNGYFDENATTPSYDDMEGYGWANSAVAYCENKGIVNGVGAGKFEPATTLNGYMFVKMLAVSMGLDPEDNFLTGDAWEIGATSVNKTLGLSKGIEDMDLSAPLSREQAAQMAYNALLAVRDGHTWVVAHGKDLHYFNNEADAILFWKATAGASQPVTGDKYTTLGYEVFRLTGVEDGFDKWGNPYYGWVAAGKFITKHEYEAVASYNTAIAKSKLYADAVAGGVEEQENNKTEDYISVAKHYVDGANMGNVVFAQGETGLVKYSGNGTSLKVYNTASGVILVTINEYIGYISETYKANAITDADPYAILTSMCDCAHPGPDCEEDYILPGEYTKGSVYLYNICHNALTGKTEWISLGTPNTVTGKLNNVADNAAGEHDDVWTIGEAKYNLSMHNNVIASQSIAATWYVDSCGNLMALKERLEAEYTVAYLVEYDAENFWKADHSAVVQEASEVFTFYDPATGETYKLTGAVEVKTAGKNDRNFAEGTVYTDFVAAAPTALVPYDCGMDDADAFDLKDKAFDNGNDYISLGLVVYMTNEAGEIVYISDEASFANEIVIATVNADGDLDIAGETKTETMTYYVDAEGNVYDEIDEYYYQWNTKYVVTTVTEAHTALDNAVEVVTGNIDVYTKTAYTYDKVTVTTNVYAWDKTAEEYVLVEELSGAAKPYTTNYKFDIVPSIGTCDEETVFYYDALTKITNCAATSAVGFANAKTLTALGEVALDMTGKEVEIIAVAQYKDAPAPSSAPSTEYVYVGSDYDFTVVTEIEYNELGYPVDAESYAVATGLYVDGVSVGELYLTVDEAFLLDGQKGQLWQFSVSVKNEWTPVKSVSAYYGDVTAIYYGNILKIGAGYQMNLAEGCVVVRVNNMYGTVAVDSVKVGDSVVFADFNKAGEATLIYVTNIDD